jgi:hypothetical protein
MKRSWLGIAWFCIWIGLLSFATLVSAQIQNVNAWPHFIILLVGHFLYFFQSRSKFSSLASLLVQIGAYLLILISIALMSANGNTWGNSLGYLGLLILLPAVNSFLGAARFRGDLRFRWYSISAGIIGLIYTFWQMLQANRLRELHRNEVSIYWGPDANLQYVAITSSILMSLAGLVAFFRMMKTREIHREAP